MNARALALVALLAWPLQPLDDAVRADVQAERTPWLERPMHLVTEGGRPLLVAGGIAAAFAGAGGRALLAEAAVVLVPVNLVVEGLKWWTWRARPDGTRRHGNASFPSSHAANAFAVAVLLARRWRRGAPAFVLVAALVSYSRLYLNRHWLTDVLAGALIGALLAWGLARVWAKRRAGSVRAGLAGRAKV
jgi:membrane-associated phospholipid phosphatase